MATDKYLSIYLNDHLAAVIALRGVARRSERANRGSELGEYLATVAADLDASAEALAALCDRLGVRRDPFKRALAWAAPRIGGLKLNGHLRTYSPLSRVVELEALIVGAEVEARTWSALAPVAGDDFSARIEACDRRRHDLARHHAAAVETALGNRS